MILINSLRRTIWRSSLNAIAIHCAELASTMGFALKEKKLKETFLNKKLEII
jgi:hypothetical protein